MDQFNTIFEHFNQYCIVVCKECYQGIVKSQIRTHLDSRHAYLSVKTRKDIVAATSGIRWWAGSEEEVVFPQAGSKPVHHLAMLDDGFKCMG